MWLCRITHCYDAVVEDGPAYMQKNFTRDKMIKFKILSQLLENLDCAREFVTVSSESLLQTLPGLLYQKDI